MTDLSSHLVAAARAGLTPDDATMARVRARVAATLAAGATGAAASAAQAAGSASSPLAGMSAASAPGAGTAGALSAAAGATGAGAIATHASGVAAFSAAGMALSLAVAVIAIGGGVVVASRVISAESSVTAPVVPAPILRSEDELPRAFAVARFEPAAPPRPAPAPLPARPVTTAAGSAVSLAREVELVDRAMVALRAGHAAAAMLALSTLETETRGRGQLAEDAAAIAIEASCQLGRDVTAALSRFDLRFPGSAQRARIHAACDRAR